MDAIAEMAAIADKCVMVFSAAWWCRRSLRILLRWQRRHVFTAWAIRSKWRALLFRLGGRFRLSSLALSPDVQPPLGVFDGGGRLPLA